MSWRAFIVSKFSVVGQANQIGSLLKRKFENWRHPHVINANHNKYPPICALVSDYAIVFLAAVISLGQATWPITFKIKIACNQWKAQHGPNVFFGFAGSEGGGGIFNFPLVPNVFLVSSQWVWEMLTVCSLQVLTMFPMMFSWCFQDVFQVPIVFPNTFPRAPHFYPIWFDKCCPSLIYLYY